MNKQHHYNTELRWTGNRGSGTSHYSSFDRSHSIKVKDKPEIKGSSDPAFKGDYTKYNPEELFLSALSACHMLWYLHLCARENVIVLGYSDQAIATMVETPDGGGKFTSATLKPSVVIDHQSMYDKALELHQKAGERCFIANSVNFKVEYQTQCRLVDPTKESDML